MYVCSMSNGDALGVRVMMKTVVVFVQGQGGMWSRGCHENEMYNTGMCIYLSIHGGGAPQHVI